MSCIHAYNCISIQRTIAALKLKNSVERETLNDMHMKAIKVIKLINIIHKLVCYCNNALYTSVYCTNEVLYCTICQHTCT